MRKFTAFGMTRRAGRSVSNDPGVAALLDAKADAICFVAKVVGLSGARRAGDHERGKSRLDPRQRAAAKAAGREVMLDCEHFFDGYKENADVRAGLRQGGLRVRRALGGAVRHQRRHDAARDRDDRARCRQAYPRRSCRHPRAQRHRAGGRQFAGRGARRRAADPGHAERPRRALRQRQSVFADPDAAAEERIRRRVRDRRHRRTSWRR